MVKAWRAMVDFLRWRFFIGRYPAPLHGKFGRFWPVGFAWHRETEAVYRNGRRWIVYWWNEETELW